MKKFLVPDLIYKAVEIERERYGSNPTEDDIAFFEQMAYERVEFYPSAVKATLERLSLGKRIGLLWLIDLRNRHAPYVNKSAISSGDKHYNWMFIPDRLKSVETPLFICAGAGINVSFEIDLAIRYPTSRLYILDPTPQSVAHFENFNFPQNVDFVPVGLGGIDGTVKFYKPDIKGVGSLSTMQLNPGNEYFSLPITRVSTFCSARMLDPSAISLLKFDIEGAEHAVIDDLLAMRIFPDQVTCEFDQPCPPWTIEASIKKLIAVGYEVASIWDGGVLFVSGKK